MWNDPRLAYLEDILRITRSKFGRFVWGMAAGQTRSERSPGVAFFERLLNHIVFEQNLLPNLRSHSESRCRWIRRRFWFQAAFDVREWAQRPMTEQKTRLGPTPSASRLSPQGRGFCER